MDIDYHSQIRSDIVHLVPQSNRLLDVGGGTGATARHLKEIGRAQRIGVMDAIVEQHKEGLDFSSSANLNDLAAVDAFLCETGQLDTILLLDVLEHLIDPWSLVRTLSEHLLPGGAMIASVPNIRHISVMRPLLFKNQWNYSDNGLLDRTHLRFFVRETAIALLQQPGLTVDFVKGTAITNRKHRAVNAMTLGAASSFFTLQYLIRARRDG